MSSTALLLRQPKEVFNLTYIYDTRFKEQDYQFDDPEGKPDAKVWVVLAGREIREKTGKGWCVWVEPEYYEEKKQCNFAAINWIGRFDSRLSKRGFSMGRPMTAEYISIPLCVGTGRPSTLYRAVHSQHPCGGTHARGYGKIEVNPLTFQVHFQKHIKWSCRDKSPFMSATDDLYKAERISALYEQMGFTGIEILVMKPRGSEWRDTQIFHVRTLVDKFGLPTLSRRWYIDNEFLIKDKIPTSRLRRLTLYNVKSRCAESHWKETSEDARKEVERNKGRKRKREEAEAVPREGPKKTRRARTQAFDKVDH